MKKNNLAAFILMAGIGLNAHAMGNPEFHVENNPDRFIPRGKYYVVVADNEIIGSKYKFSLFWYNPDYKTISDYITGICWEDECFVDINGDGIPDMTLPDAKEAYREMKEREERQNLKA